MLAIVTGGTRGIGLAISKMLLYNGFEVVVSARGKNEEIEKLIAENNGKFSFCACDISKSEDRRSLLEFARAKGEISLLVNNAGVAPKTRKNILEIDEDDFDYVVDINLKGTYFMCQLLGSYFKATGQGRIINISSISSYTASTSRGEYCIAKAGISMVTKLFASELSACGAGVFEIMPGVIATDMIEGVKEKYIDMINNGLTPLRRLGEGEDIAKCVLAIAEGKLDFCVGQTLNADGGFSIRRL